MLTDFLNCSVMSNFNKYYCIHVLRMTEEQYKAQLAPSVFNESLPKLNAEIVSIIDSVAPISEVTGNRVNDVDRLLDPNVSPMEKEAVLSRMQRVPMESRKNVPDKDLVRTVSSRYNSTLTDVDKVKDAFENDVLPSISEEEKLDVGSDVGSDAGSSE